MSSGGIQDTDIADGSTLTAVTLRGEALGASDQIINTNLLLITHSDFRLMDTQQIILMELFCVLIN